MSDPMILGSLTGLFLLMAVLYSSVGQGGGSGYLAAMALVGVAPENFRLIALSLNVVVASIGIGVLVSFSRVPPSTRSIAMSLLDVVPLWTSIAMLLAPSSNRVWSMVKVAKIPSRLSEEERVENPIEPSGML